MKRFAVSLCALLCVAVPSAASAAAAPVHGSLTGKITYVGSSSLTIQSHGRLMGVVNAMTRTANALTAADYPYVWGGGHPEAGTPSVGSRGPGYNGRRRGFDCSGSVAAVLAGAGLWRPGSGVPGDAGVIAELLAERLIARGPGKAPNSVNLYDDRGVHIFMSIDGRFFGTSDGGGGNRRGGPTWLDDGAWDSYNRAFKRYHFLPWVLRNKTYYGHDFTFQTSAAPSLVYGAEAGERVKVSYIEKPTGSMVPTAVQYAGQTMVTGTVSALSDSTLTLQTADGSSLTFSTSLVPALLTGVQVGDGVQIAFSRDPMGALVPHALAIVSQPQAPPPAGGSS